MVISYLKIIPAFHRRFNYREVGDPPVALVPAADLVLLEDVEDLVEAVVGRQQHLEVDSKAVVGCVQRWSK